MFRRPRITAGAGNLGLCRIGRCCLVR